MHFYPHLAITALDHMQAIQTAAARLLTRSNRRSHITPLLTSLHWLPVVYKIQFKILSLTYSHGSSLCVSPSMEGG